MADSEEIRELTAELHKLVDKLGAPKRKDWTEHLTVVSSFFSTVVIALLGLYFTHQAQKTESERQGRFQDAQVAMQREQIRADQLRAMTTLAPLLSSKDSAERAVGRMILESMDATRQAASAPQPAAGTRPAAPGDGAGAVTPPGAAGSQPAVVRTAGAAGDASMLDAFIRLAMDAQESENSRVAALRRIEQVATSQRVTPAVRQRALDAASTIAVTPGVPAEVRRTAEQVISGIQRVEPDRIAGVIAAAPLTRTVREIIIHHSAPITTTTFRGSRTILSLAQFQLGEQHWQRVSWHYAIAPDGAVWLGMPLDEKATHVLGHQEQSVSVLLVMDGDHELPTPAQQRTFGIVMRSVQRRVGLSPGDPGAALLHRYVPGTGKTCPGTLVTPELVSTWIGSG